MASPGVLHAYTDKLVAFEYAMASPPTSSLDAKNTILWVGGLSNGLCTVKYPKAIAAVLPPGWSLAEVLISSTYEGWRTGNLKRDARELGECVNYFRKQNKPAYKGNNEAKTGKIVIMGHSTGCQDIMEYLVGEGCEERSHVDGVILQSGVSDREAWIDTAEKNGQGASVNALIEKSKAYIDEGRGLDAMPREGNFMLEEGEAQITAYRTYSLLVKGGDDDYFSSDLSDDVLQTTFGRMSKLTSVVMFLLGSVDQYVPEFVDKSALLDRWAKVIRENGGVVDEKDGGIVQDAHHDLKEDPETVVRDLVHRVVEFVRALES